MTDRQRDIDMAISVIGRSNDYFKDIWIQFASGWDGAPCSEIACCISYMAGNLNTIPVSNYAAGLVDEFRKRGRFGFLAEPGSFIFFTYGNGPEHTGRVIDVNDHIITTVEGNIDNKVVQRSYYDDSAYIYGYGYPDYSEIEDHITPEEFINAAIYDIELKKGCEGYSNLILMVQRYLKDIGLYNGSIDGVYGSFTESAVVKYQKANNLAVDGWIGPYCWRKLLNND